MAQPHLSVDSTAAAAATAMSRSASGHSAVSTAPSDVQDVHATAVIATAVSLRQRLIFTKQDPARITPDLLNDVAQSLDDVVAQLMELDEPGLRHGRAAETVEDGCVLLGFCYISLGDRHHVASVMVQLVALKWYLDCLERTHAFTLDELNSASEYLEAEVAAVTPLTTDLASLKVFLNNYAQLCRSRIERMQRVSSQVVPELRATHALLVRLRRDLVMRLASYLLSAHAPSFAEESTNVSKLRLRLQELDSRRSLGRFAAKTTLDTITEVRPDLAPPPPADTEDTDPGQAWLSELMDACQADLHRITASKRGKPLTSPPGSKSDVSGPGAPASSGGTGSSGPGTPQATTSSASKHLAQELLSVKHDLERSLLTRRWTFREPDLWEMWVRLAKGAKRIEDLAHDPLGLDMCRFLSYKCRGLVLRLLRPDAAHAVVAPQLVPVRNQLLTLRKCLQELQRLGGEVTDRDLYLYQMKLSHLDSQRVDGKFAASDGVVPEGQGVLMDLLEECYELLDDMKGAATDTDSDQGDTAGGAGGADGESGGGGGGGADNPAAA